MSSLGPKLSKIPACRLSVQSGSFEVEIHNPDILRSSGVMRRGGSPDENGKAGELSTIVVVVEHSGIASKVGVTGPRNKGWLRLLDTPNPPETPFKVGELRLSLLKVDEDVIDAGETISVSSSVLHAENRLTGRSSAQDSSAEVQSEKWLCKTSMSSAAFSESRACKASSITDEGEFGRVGNLFSSALYARGVGVSSVARGVLPIEAGKGE